MDVEEVTNNLLIMFDTKSLNPDNHGWDNMIPNKTLEPPNIQGGKVIRVLSELIRCIYK